MERGPFEAVTKLIAQTRLIAVATSELSANFPGTRTQSLSMSGLPLNRQLTIQQRQAI